MAYNELVLDSNSVGVRLLELGRLAEARSYFQQALDVLQYVRESQSPAVQQLEVEPSQDLGSPQQPQLSQQQSLLQQHQSLPQPESHPIQGWTCSIRHDDDGGGKDHLYVYSRAIDLTPNFLVQHLHIYQTAITFNLALTHHLIALLLTPTSSSDYQTASTLYEESMAALGRVFETSTAFDDDPYLNDVRLVILNNAGHIYYTDMANIPVATQCFQTVCGIISDSVRIGPPTALPPTELHRMVANALVQYIHAAPVA
jgi:hypothetical protein